LCESDTFSISAGGDIDLPSRREAPKKTIFLDIHIQVLLVTKLNWHKHSNRATSGCFLTKSQLAFWQASRKSDKMIPGSDSNVELSGIILDYY
jgi:hypothetical protein